MPTDPHDRWVDFRNQSVHGDRLVALLIIANTALFGLLYYWMTKP